mgnify:CR=1 FL=1
MIFHNRKNLQQLQNYDNVSAVTIRDFVFLVRRKSNFHQLEKVVCLYFLAPLFLGFAAETNIRGSFEIHDPARTDCWLRQFGC